MEEKQIGTTDLRQNLTDVLQEIKEEKAVYVVETFGRPQAVMVNVDDYRGYQRYQAQREDFFKRLREAAAMNAEHNADMTEEEVLELIEEVREEVYQDSLKEKRS